MALFVSPAEYDAWCIKEAIYVSTVGKKRKVPLCVCGWKGLGKYLEAFTCSLIFTVSPRSFVIPCDVCTVSLLKSRE